MICEWPLWSTNSDLCTAYYWEATGGRPSHRLLHTKMALQKSDWFTGIPGTTCKFHLQVAINPTAPRREPCPLFSQNWLMQNPKIWLKSNQRLLPVTFLLLLWVWGWFHYSRCSFWGHVTTWLQPWILALIKKMEWQVLSAYLVWYPCFWWQRADCPWNCKRIMRQALAR